MFAIFSSIFALGKVSHVHSKTPDDRQETPKDPQENFDDPQDTCQVLQELDKMTEYSWRNLTFNE
jgi:hypothetical protein